MVTGSERVGGSNGDREGQRYVARSVACKARTLVVWQYITKGARCERLRPPLVACQGQAYLEGGREGGRKAGCKGGREGDRDARRERGAYEGREGGWEGGRETQSMCVCVRESDRRPCSARAPPPAPRRLPRRTLFATCRGTSLIRTPPPLRPMTQALWGSSEVRCVLVSEVRTYACLCYYQERRG
jgi:hypothetical protein